MVFQFHSPLPNLFAIASMLLAVVHVYPDASSAISTKRSTYRIASS